MRSTIRRRMGWALVLVGGFTAFILPMSRGAQREVPRQRVSVPYDWSHHHAKFSTPSTPAQAQTLQLEPRYWHQQFRRNPPHVTAENTSNGSGELPLPIKLLELRRFGGPKDSNGKWPGLRPPWGQRPLLVFYFFAMLTSLALLVAIRRRPPAFRRLVVAWWAMAALLATSAGLLTSCNGSQVSTASGAPVVTSSVPYKNPSSSTANDELHRDWAFSMSSLTAGTATTGSATNYPAKFSFDVNVAPDCTKDYVALNTSLPGASGPSGTPNIIALNQLYSSQAGSTPAGYCGTNGPSVMWSYFTGAGSAQTSVALSGIGDKVAFVETSASGAVLRILRGATGEGTTITSPQTPTNSYVNTAVGTPTAWNTTNCPNGQSCLISVPFQDGNQDTNSSPFYDYATDVLYVGDNNGVLHAFSGVFLGTPTEVTTGGWPITVDAGTILTSPVFDATSRNIFVADSAGTIWYVRGAGSSSGSCASGTSLPCLGTPNIPLTGSIVDGPLVDGTTGHVFWFDGQDTTNHGEVVQTDIALGNSVTLSGVSGTATGSPMFAGDFDNSYYASSANNVTGFLYFCGKDPTQVDAPAIWRVGFSSTGVMNSVPSGGTSAYRTLVYSAVVSNPPSIQCSPVTEVFNTNTSTDWIFLSVANLNYPCLGQTACLMSLNLTTLTSWPPGPGGDINGFGGTGMTAVSNVSTGGTGGILIDNVALTTPGNFPQASSIYFSWLGSAGASLLGGGGSTFQCNSATTGGCFQKLTQAGLQ